MTVMKAITDSGFELKGSKTLTNMTFFLADQFLYNLPGVVVFDCEQPDAEERAQIMEELGAATGDTSRYVFFPMPEGAGGPEEADAYTLLSLDQLAAKFAQGPRFHGMVMDMMAVAKQVVSRAALPLFTFTLDEEDA